MKKVFFILFINILFTPLVQAREVACEDLEYRHHLTRTDIELVTRIHHESNYKSALLRELQDQERYLQEEIRNLKCYQ